MTPKAAPLLIDRFIDPDYAHLYMGESSILDRLHGIRLKTRCLIQIYI